MRLNVFALASIAFFTSSAAFGYEEYSKFKGWDIDVYSNDGQPFQCLGFTRYEGGMVTFVGFERYEDKDLFKLKLQDDSWKSIEEGKEYQLTVKFPNREPWTLNAEGSTGKFSDGSDYFEIIIYQELGEIAYDFISDFRKTTFMELLVEKNKIGKFKLKGTMGMMSEVARCYQEKVKSKPQSDPFSSSSKEDPFDL
jgi:hypothetical protein